MFAKGSVVAGYALLAVVLVACTVWAHVLADAQVKPRLVYRVRAVEAP
jgi:hypothetical protein